MAILSNSDFTFNNSGSIMAIMLHWEQKIFNYFQEIFWAEGSFEFLLPDMSEVLETLFGSKARTRILRFFLLNGGKDFSAAEIAKKNMLAGASARKELNDLKKIKFISEKIKKGTKYYALDQSFCFFTELKTLFAKSTASPESKTLAKIKNIGDVKLALISGIFLNNPKSKVDMILVANNVSRSKLSSVMNSLEAEIGKEVSFVLMTSEEFKYRIDMLDRFLFDFMEETHLELIDKVPGLKRLILSRKK